MRRRGGGSRNSELRIDLEINGLAQQIDFALAGEAQRGAGQDQIAGLGDAVGDGEGGRKGIESGAVPLVAAPAVENAHRDLAESARQIDWPLIVPETIRNEAWPFKVDISSAGFGRVALTDRLGESVPDTSPKPKLASKALSAARPSPLTLNWRAGVSALPSMTSSEIERASDIGGLAELEIEIAVAQIGVEAGRRRCGRRHERKHGLEMSRSASKLRRAERSMRFEDHGVERKEIARSVGHAAVTRQVDRLGR